MEGNISFDEDEFCSKLVYCIQSSVIDDVNDIRKELNLHTKNYEKTIHIDYLYTKLVKIFNDGAVFTEDFKVGFWNGLFMYSNSKRSTFTVMSKSRFKDIKKTGKTPKYLKAFLYGENKNLVSQETLFDSPLSDEIVKESEMDFYELTKNIDLDVENVNHYIIVFNKNKSALLSVEVLLVTPMLDIVREWNLSSYISAYSDVETTTTDIASDIPNKNATATLVTIKGKVNPLPIVKEEIKENVN